MIGLQLGRRVAAVDAAGAGDCNQIGDFLTAVRDGWMLALGIDMRLPQPGAGKRR